LLDDEPRSGGPLNGFLDIQILSSLEKQPFHLAYPLAEILDVSHTTILNHLGDSLGMKLFSAQSPGVKDRSNGSLVAIILHEPFSRTGNRNYYINFVYT
jgi:hypothetical protein